MISQIFKKTKQLSISQGIDELYTAKLDESLNLLSTTAMEVSEAAVSAALVLKEELHDSYYRFHSTIDAIDDLVIIKDDIGRWKTVNRWGQFLYGWHHGEYHTKTDDELKRLYPQFRESLTTCQRTDALAWTTRRSYRSEEYIPHGNTIYILDVVKTPVFHADGTKKELIVVGRDVTQIYEKSKRTKACFNALNSASDVIFIVDKYRNMFFCNDQFIHMFKFGQYDHVVGKPLEECMPDIQKYDEMWHTIMNNKTWEDVYNGEFKLTIIPMMNGAPDPIYYVCTLKPLV